MKGKCSLVILLSFFATLILIQSCGSSTFQQNNPPSIPTDPNPENGATNVSITPSLSWSSIDPDGDSLMFDVYLGNENNLQLIAPNHTSTIYQIVTSLNYNTRYYLENSGKGRKGWRNSRTCLEFHYRITTTSKSFSFSTE